VSANWCLWLRSNKESRDLLPGAEAGASDAVEHVEPLGGTRQVHLFGYEHKGTKPS